MRALPFLSLFSICLLITSFGYSQNTCTDNLLTNPGFENGLTAGWTVTGAAALSNDAHTGTKAGSICTGSGSIGKALPATPGMEYTAGFWVKKSGNIGVGQTQLRFLTSSFSPIVGSESWQNTVNTTYTKVELSGTAPANAAYVHLYIHKSIGGCLFLDDAELCESELPASCNISVSLSNMQCDDNNTPNNLGDDLFTVDITATNPGGGSGFLSGALIPNGLYGVPYTYGPALISAFGNNGNYLTNVRDVNDASCVASYSVVAPAPCSVPISSGACTTNLLTNGGFENGLSNWTKTGVTAAGTDAYSGSQAAQICNGSGSIGKAVPAVVGATYQASMWVKKSSGNFTATAQLRFLTSSYSPISGSADLKNITNNGFTKLEFSGVAPANAAFVHVHIYKGNGSGCVVVDELELCEEADGPTPQDGCSFIQIYSEATEMEVNRNFSVMENGNGSFTGVLEDDAPDGNTYVRELLIDKDGNFQSLNPVGYFPTNDNTTFEKNGWTVMQLVSNNSTIRLTRYNLSGTQLWEKNFVVENAYITAHSKTLLKDGGFLLTGSYEKPGAQDGKFYAFYIRVNENGTLIWQRQPDTGLNTYTSVEVLGEAEDGRLYILLPYSNNYYTLLGMNPDGTIDWSYGSPSTAYIAVENFSQSEDGNYLFYAIGVFPSAPQTVTYEFFGIVKRHRDGNVIWGKSIFRNYQGVEVTGMTALADGGVAVSYLTRSNESRFTRLDASGEILWDKQLPQRATLTEETNDEGLLFYLINATPILIKATADGHFFPACSDLPVADEDCTHNIAYGHFNCAIPTAEGDLKVVTHIARSFSTSILDATGNLVSDPISESRIPGIRIVRNQYGLLLTQDGLEIGFINANEDPIYNEFSSYSAVIASPFGNGYLFMGFKNFNTSNGILSDFTIIRTDANLNIIQQKIISEITVTSHGQSGVSLPLEIASNKIAFVCKYGLETNTQSTLFVLDNNLNVLSTMDVFSAHEYNYGTLGTLACGGYKITGEGYSTCNHGACEGEKTYWGDFVNNNFVVQKSNSYQLNSAEGFGTRSRSWTNGTPTGTMYTATNVDQFTPDSPPNNQINIVKTVSGNTVYQKTVELPDPVSIISIEEINGEPVFLLQASGSNIVSLVNIDCLEEISTTGMALPCGTTYTKTASSFTLTGLSAGHLIVKVFSPSWQTMYSCQDNCNNPLTMSGLAPGTYHVSVKKYNASWQLECSLLEDIVITGNNLQSQSDEQLFFNAIKDGREVSINWASNAGEVTDHYVVEHSADGEYFSALLTHDNFSESDQFLDYQTRDVKPLLGYNYYRLKQVYRDGTFRYTGSKAIFFDTDLSKILVFPNPAEDVLYLNVKPYLGAAVEVSIVNQLGAVVYQKYIDEVTADLMTFEVSDLQSGLFFITVKTENNKIQTLRFVKVRR